MRQRLFSLGLVALLVGLAVPAVAQDYRARVQGAVTDSSQGALPGVNVTLKNDNTGVEVVRQTDATGRYLFDFVDPGTYTIVAELEGFKRAEQKNVRVTQRGDITADLTLEIGALSESITVEAAPVAVQFNSSSSDMTLESKLIDQVPISGRNPYNLVNLDPTNTLSVNVSENRPYHHAYANDYDAGGGTRRGNSVLLDGVPLGASYKTAYTPAMDAVEEITVSKNSVDAENGNSLGGIISLNMKSGTNVMHGSAYYFGRNPSLNARADPTVVITPTTNVKNLRGTDLSMFGGTFGGPIKKNKIFSFTSFEQWFDNKPITIVRTVPTALERQGDFSQSVTRAGRVRTVFDPWSSVRDPATGRIVRTQFPGNVIPSNRLDPTALKMLAQIPMPNQPGNTDNWQGTKTEEVDYWNFSQRVDVNITDNWKVFGRYGQFKANTYEQNPTEGGFFPLAGSNRYGMTIAGDSVWVMSNKATLNVRGSFYNMTDEFYNPELELGTDGLAEYWPNNPWYTPMYNTGYVYYPRLDVVSGTGSSGNTLGRNGSEWFQRPDAWNLSARMNWYQGRHNMKWGGEFRNYYGEAARFQPMNLSFNSAFTANSSDSPDVANTGNEWAAFMLGAIHNNSAANVIPLQTPYLRSYSLYFQDDWRLNDRLTLNLGLRWEYEPGPTDPEDRLSQRIDLTSPIPEMQTTPPQMNAQAAALMASKGYSYVYNGAWVFTSSDSRHVWNTAQNFLPRVGFNYRLGDDSVFRFGYARYIMPVTNIRDTLGDFVAQYAGYSQTTNPLSLSNGVPRQVLANPFPANVNPVIEPYGQAYGRYTNLGGNANLDEFDLKPQINDRLNFSYQKQMWGVIFDVNYFLNLASRVYYDKDLNMMDPAFRYEQKAAINASVPNPFYQYLTTDKFPGQLRNSSTVALSSLLRPYPQYSQLLQTRTDDGRNMRTHTFEVRGQRPFKAGLSFLGAYAWNSEKREEWFDDLAQYEVFQSEGGSGWEWRVTDSPVHRITAAVTWEIPVGRQRAYWSNMPVALDWVIGGWQLAASTRWYSGRPVLFTTSYIVSGEPKISDPANDKWFDTSVFKLQDTFTPRNNPFYYEGLNGPTFWLVDSTLTKNFNIGEKFRVEARLEAYNLLNHLNWDQPEVSISSANFGKVTRRRTDSNGRELQFGLRFVF
jgi:hypothetical protein